MKTAANSLSRNAPCWCGSGKKFKKCHLGKEQIQSPPMQENPHFSDQSSTRGRFILKMKSKSKEYEKAAN